MSLQEQNILFFTRTMKLGGTENVILQLCEVLRPIVNKIIVCSCGGVNVEKLTLMGIKHYEIPDIEEKRLPVIIKTVKKINQIINKEKITVIHTHHRMAAFYVYIMKLYKKCKFINTSHNTFENKKWFTQLAYSKADLITCGTKVKENLVDYYRIPEKRITVIHNAVKPFAENIVIDETIKALHEKKKFIVGNIGRLSKQKGMEYYIKCIPMVMQEHPEAFFVIVGSGEDEKKLRNLAFELEVEKDICFMGYRSDIQNLMSQMDLIVLSSLWEGLPLTPIEAFSVEKTIVATDVDGTKEIVEDGVNGLLVKAKNEKEIAEKINYLLDNPSKKKEFEINARNSYKECFSFGKFTENYITYYRKHIS